MFAVNANRRLDGLTGGHQRPGRQGELDAYLDCTHDEAPWIWVGYSRLRTRELSSLGRDAVLSQCCLCGSKVHTHAYAEDEADNEQCMPAVGKHGPDGHCDEDEHRDEDRAMAAKGVGEPAAAIETSETFLR